MTHIVTQGTTFSSPSNVSLIPTTSNLIPTTSSSAALGLPSVHATINDLADGGIIQLTFHDEYIPLKVPISPAISLPSVNLMQEQYSLHIEIEEPKDHQPAFIYVYSDEGEPEVDPDDPTHLDDHYPSELEAGKDNNGEYRLELEGESGMEAGMEEVIVQDESVIQDAQYSDQ